MPRPRLFCARAIAEAKAKAEAKVEVEAKVEAKAKVKTKTKAEKDAWAVYQKTLDDAMVAYLKDKGK